jgi:hypothetical protein
MTPKPKIDYEKAAAKVRAAMAGGAVLTLAEIRAIIGGGISKYCAAGVIRKADIKPHPHLKGRAACYTMRPDDVPRYGGKRAKMVAEISRRFDRGDILTSADMRAIGIAPNKREDMAQAAGGAGTRVCAPKFLSLLDPDSPQAGTHVCAPKSGSAVVYSRLTDGELERRGYKPITAGYADVMELMQDGGIRCTAEIVAMGYSTGMALRAMTALDAYSKRINNRVFYSITPFEGAEKRPRKIPAPKDPKKRGPKKTAPVVLGRDTCAAVILGSLWGRKKPTQPTNQPTGDDRR